LNIYADSSFIVALYARDSHSVQALRRIRQRPRVWLTPLHKLEFSHAVAQQVFRRNLSEADAGLLFEKFDQDCANFVWELTDLPLEAFPRGTILARKYVSACGTRSFDTLHIASALELGCEEFWTFDDRQAKLAVAVGLNVL
jgi:predicted nucleic acid-binding protein